MSIAILIFALVLSSIDSKEVLEDNNIVIWIVEKAIDKLKEKNTNNRAVVIDKAKVDIKEC